MAKPPISYGVVRNYGSSYNIIAITSTDKSYYYGRRDNDQTTRGKLTDLLAQRPTWEAAQSLIVAIKDSVGKHSPGIKDAERLVDKLRAKQQEDIKWLANK